MMDKKQVTPQDTSSFNTTSKRLRLQKDHIIENWKNRATNEVKAAQEISRTALIDSLPKFIDRLADALDESNMASFGEVKDVAKEHAEHRVDTAKYSIEQIIYEYQILRNTVLNLLEEQGQLAILERDVILKTIDSGIEEAAKEFIKLRAASELIAKEEEAKRSAVVKVALDCIISMDATGNITEFNPAAENTFGYTRSEVLGKELSEIIIPPEYRERHKKGVERYLTTRKSNYMGKRLNFPAIKKDGGRIQVELTILEIPGTNPPSFTGFLRDITNQIIAENKLKELTEEATSEKEKFEILFKDAPAAMALLKGPTHIFEKANSFYNSLVGNRQIIGRSVLEALPEVESQPYIEILDNVFKTGETYIGKESMLELKESAEGPALQKYMDFTYLRINDREGKPYGVLAHAVDVTEKVISRKIISEANEALQESEKRFRSFIEAMPQMAFVADEKGDIIYFNQRFYDYVGMGKETQGWGWKNVPILHPDDLERTVKAWTRSIETGEPYQIEYLLRRHDGQYRWHLGRAVPITNEQGKITRWFGTNTDIDNQKKIVSELEQERAIREQFVATLTHDLRNPLTAVKTSAQMVIRSPEKPEIRERAMSRIISAVERSDNMIRNLLDANLIQAGKQLPLQMDNCDLSQVAEEIVEEMKVIHGNRFFLQTPRPLIGVWSCDGIRRILDNLISNAVKYGDQEKEVSLKLEDRNHHVLISIHNFGKPIPLEEQKTLFEPFRRAQSAVKSTLKGWGLGLTLVKGITEAHGGKISMESTEAAGTTFRVELPKKAS